MPGILLPAGISRAKESKKKSPGPVRVGDGWPRKKAVLFLGFVFFRAHDGQPLGKGNDERNADTDGAEHDAVDEFLTSLTVSLGVHS